MFPCIYNGPRKFHRYANHLLIGTDILVDFLSSYSILYLEELAGKFWIRLRRNDTICWWRKWHLEMSSTCGLWELLISAIALFARKFSVSCAQSRVGHIKHFWNKVTTNSPCENKGFWAFPSSWFMKSWRWENVWTDSGRRLWQSGTLLSVKLFVMKAIRWRKVMTKSYPAK